jgi:uncharacterized membrane protein
MKTSYILIALAIAVVLYLLTSKTTIRTGTPAPSGGAGYLTAGAALITAGANAYSTVSDAGEE